MASGRVKNILRNLTYTTEGLIFDDSVATYSSGGYIEIGQIVIVAIKVETVRDIGKNEIIFRGLPPCANASKNGPTSVYMANVLGDYSVFINRSGAAETSASTSGIKAGKTVSLNGVYLTN